MTREEIDSALEKYDKYIAKNGIDEKVIRNYSIASRAAYQMDDFDLAYATKISQKTKRLIQKMLFDLKGYGIDEIETHCNNTGTTTDFLQSYYNVCLDEAPYYFASYMTYLEKNRPEKDKFYKPRKKCLNKLGIIQAMQDLSDGKYTVMSLSLPPGTGKTTLEKFFASWQIGKDIEGYSLFWSHSNDIADMFYRGIVDITTNGTVYTWNEIFPGAKLESTNAKKCSINFGNYKQHASLQTTSNGAENAGKVRANKFLYVDDMIGKQEEALNKNTLDKLWNTYAVDSRQRMVDGCRQLHLATRWSVHDVIGRLQILYEGNPKAKFIAYPDIDPKTGKSNFNYDREGFSEEFFHEQEMAMDEISYKCLFKNEPIEREGLLYHKDDVRRYFELPNREPDAILGVCDTKSKGIDFMVMPIIYVYGEDHYMVDCVCDDSSDYNIQETRLAKLICYHNMQRCEFESNAGGDRLAKNVADKVKALEGRCSITTKPTETNKETRIIVNSNWVKEHVLFKDSSLYVPKSDYGKFMNQLFSYSVAGKNVHDDVPDALANYTLFVTKPERKVARIMRGIL